MRHLVGVALAIAMSAAVFFAASWGYLKLVTEPAKGSVLVGSGGSLIHDHTVLEGFGLLLAVGLLAGILMAVPAISPLASGLPGLAMLAWSGLYLFSVRRAVQYVPLKPQSYGTGFEAMLFDGIIAMAGLAMIVPLFVPSRWRSRAVVAEAAPYEATPPAFPDPGTTQTMAGGGGLLSDWAETRPQPRLDPGRAQAPWDPAEPGSAAAPGSPPDYS